MRKITVFITFSIMFGLLQYKSNAQDCGTRQLDPRVANFLKMIGNADLTIEQFRKLPMEKIKMGGPPVIPYPENDVRRIKITADSIPVLVFNPTHNKNLPILIEYHGGGFILPLLPGFEHEIWEEAKTFNAIVFAVDYRVAPENKFPAAVNDSYNSFKWISEHGGEFGGDTSRLVIKGSSAGANLVAVIAQKANKEGIVKRIKLQIMNGLPIDGRPENLEKSASYQENAKGYMQTKAGCYFSIENYAPGELCNNPEASPIITKDLRGLPPAVIINAEFDPLRDDGVLYAAKLRSFSVRVWDKCFAGQIHCLVGLPENSAEITEYHNIVLTAMKESFKR